MSVTVFEIDGGTVLVSEPDGSTVIPFVDAGATVIVQQNESMVLVTPPPVQSAPVVEETRVVRVQEPASNSVLIFDSPVVIEGAAAVEVLPNRTERGTGNQKRYIFVGFSSAAIGSENEAAAQWKIYRYDVTTDTASFADGDEAFDNIWDNRQSLTYP